MQRHFFLAMANITKWVCGEKDKKSLGLVGFGVCLGPFVVESDEGTEAVGFHFVVINHVDAEVEQIFGVVGRMGDERADVEFEFVEHGFGDIARRVNQALKELVAADGLEVVVGDLEMARAALVELNVVHSGFKVCSRRSAGFVSGAWVL